MNGGWELRCERVSHQFNGRGRRVLALDDLTFDVRRNEFLCLVGPSGCGKTTLLRLIAGLLSPTSGSIAFAEAVERGQPRTAIVFQEHGLFPWMTVLDNVMFGLTSEPCQQRERRERALAFIFSVGLAGFAGFYPHELSVGMRQRVGLARALIADRRVLILDEPFGSLDAQARMLLQEELLVAWQHRPKTVIYVTHDVEEAITLGDRVLVMTGRPGRIREEIPLPAGRPRDLLEPLNAETQRLKRHIWTLLEAEARRNLGEPS
jgi:NitT/TauT family transport system ATP-binding protein